MHAKLPGDGGDKAGGDTWQLVRSETRESNWATRMP